MMKSSPTPLVTIAVPSLNQGRFIGDALASIFAQDVPVEVYVADGGSSDGTLKNVEPWLPRLAGFRSREDRGQASAINEGIARGAAPYVCWLNSDDALLPGGLRILIDALEAHPEWPMAYGRAWNAGPDLRPTRRVWTQAFGEYRLAVRCIVSQPATLIRRSAWERVGGLREELQLALDYDLWWRIYRCCGVPGYVAQDVAVNRDHDATKTRLQRRQHCLEAIAVVREHYGSVPFKWWLAWPRSVWWRSIGSRPVK